MLGQFKVVSCARRLVMRLRYYSSQCSLLLACLWAGTSCAASELVKVEPADAGSVCKAVPSDQHPWGADGHLYTTARILGIVEFDPERIPVLTYYSEYPDWELDYSAVYVSIKYLLWRHTWRNGITGGLHSLHGGGRGAIDARRERIEALLRESLKDKKLDWFSGLLIHAYGDTFSHTKYEYGSQQELAYNVWIGHLLDGHKPDNIVENRPKYLGFIQKFFDLVKSDERQRAEFDRFYNEINGNICGPINCPTFRGAPSDSNDEVGKYAKCMQNAVRRLTEAEVQRVVDAINGGTSPVEASQ